MRRYALYRVPVLVWDVLEDHALMSVSSCVSELCAIKFWETKPRGGFFPIKIKISLPGPKCHPKQTETKFIQFQILVAKEAPPRTHTHTHTQGWICCRESELLCSTATGVTAQSIQIHPSVCVCVCVCAAARRLNKALALLSRILRCSSTPRAF